ncbi:MAG: glutamine synthetase family protein [Oscillospiraceae bacterium]
MYSYEDVMSYIEEENVKFIRLAFCDIFGRQKNVAIMPDELSRAFTKGVSFDASSICGFGNEIKSDMFLYPNPETLAALPWRSINGSVVRMFCDIRYPDGRPLEMDSRHILRKAIEYAESKGISCYFGAEFEFYLFETDEKGEPTDVPFDKAGYLDIAPEDRGENVRREICSTLFEMGIRPESSHHEHGPGQNEIDFRYSDALSAADNAVTFKSVVRTIAKRNGLYASFDPKPIKNQSGNAMHINISLRSDDGKDHIYSFMAGIMEHIGEMTAFLNPTIESYQRFGEMKAPKYITWSPENRSQLIRIPASHIDGTRIELRSPDPGTNPYLAYALLIYAGIDGIERGLKPDEPVNMNLYSAPEEVVKKLKCLPLSFKEASETMEKSQWIRGILPEEYIRLYR